MKATDGSIKNPGRNPGIEFYKEGKTITDILDLFIFSRVRHMLMYAYRF